MRKCTTNEHTHTHTHTYTHTHTHTHTRALDNTVLSENVDRFTTLVHKNEILASNYNGEYKTLYGDSLRKLVEHTETFQKRLIHLTTEYEELNEKYEEAIRSIKQSTKQ